MNNQWLLIIFVLFSGVIPLGLARAADVDLSSSATHADLVKRTSGTNDANNSKLLDARALYLALRIQKKIHTDAVANETIAEGLDDGHIASEEKRLKSLANNRADGWAAFTLGNIISATQPSITGSKKSFHWMKVAASYGYKPAERAIAVDYQNGIGVKRDEALASYWFNQSRYVGQVSGPYCGLAKTYTDGRWVPISTTNSRLYAQKCISDIKNLLKAHDASAEYQVGMAYINGDFPLKKNREKGIRYLYAALKNGYSPAASALIKAIRGN